MKLSYENKDMKKALLIRGLLPLAGDPPSPVLNYT